MLGENAFRFGGGFLIGATEMGIGGFGGSFGAAMGSGESFGDAMKAGGIGFGIGAITGGLIEGSYLSGMQNIAHGQSRESVYRSSVARLHALNVNKTDKTTAIVGSRPLREPQDDGGVGRHRYIRGRAGRFEMGPDQQTGLIELNGENSFSGTEEYLNHFSAQVIETTTVVSQSGFNSAVRIYNAAWVGTKYNFSNHNSNYAVNSVIYSAGGDVPGNLGYSPGFPDKDW